MNHSEKRLKEMKKSELIKILIVGTAFIMAFVLAACGGNTDSGSADNSGSVQNAPVISEIGEFATVDLDGNEVTQEVFSNSDITMINFWGTFCGPCVKEMPELQKINAKYDGRAQVIGVPLDVNFDDKDSAEYKNALKTLEWAEAEFKNIKPAGGIQTFANSMQYVPTTIFVDSEGKLIGEPVVGALTEEYKARIEEYLNQGA